MKLLINSPSAFEFSKEHLALIQQAASSLQVTVTLRPSEEELADADILLCSNSNFNPHWIANAKKLKWLQSLSAGVERILPTLPESVLLSNAKGTHSIPIAEQVLGYMLMHERRLDRCLKAQTAKQWINKELALGAAYTPGELCGKTAAIFGLGNIGRRIAQVCKALEMTVLGLGVKQDVGKVPFVDTMYSFTERQEVLKRADYIILALPSTEQTYHLFDKKAFEVMKPTAFLINIGRGSAINEKDLADALKQQKISGAALDVFESEPLPTESSLWSLENLLITPHCAGYSPKYMDRFTALFLENLKAFLGNKKMPTLVDRQKGY